MPFRWHFICVSAQKEMKIYFPTKMRKGREVNLLNDHYVFETSGEVNFHSQPFSASLFNLPPHKENVNAVIGRGFNIN